MDPKGALLKGLDAGKACIRFKKKNVVGETEIAEFIQRGVDY